MDMENFIFMVNCDKLLHWEQLLAVFHKKKEEKRKKIVFFCILFFLTFFQTQKILLNRFKTLRGSVIIFDSIDFMLRTVKPV